MISGDSRTSLTVACALVARNGPKGTTARFVFANQSLMTCMGCGSKHSGDVKKIPSHSWKNLLYKGYPVRAISLVDIQSKEVL